ncbi:hypothetical protein ACM55M_10685 [Flavobacterium sp. ZT3R25]|uniref:hypothetical protein n=1 Tax=Flavobacterium galactosi TaxID=3398735 RepID=UPI003A8A1ED5
MSRRTELASAVATIKAKRNGGVPKVGQVELTDKTLYLNVAVKGQAGIVNLVDVNTRREVGVTNIDGNKLNAGRDYIIDGVRVLWGQDVNLKAQNWGTTKSLLPAEFLGAEFRIKQGGTVLVDMPITDLTIDPFVAFRSLSTSPLIRSNMEFEMEIEYPKGVSVPVDKDYNVRFEFRAHQAKR